MADKKFRCKIENQKIDVINQSEFSRHIKKLEGKVCELIIRLPKYENLKEDELRKYYWGMVVDVIAKETGNTSEDVHETMKMMFNSVEDEFGIRKSKNVFTRGASTDVEKKRFINSVRSWALDWNIITEPYSGREIL